MQDQVNAQNEGFLRSAVANATRIVLVIVNKPPDQVGFVVLPRL